MKKLLLLIVVIAVLFGIYAWQGRAPDAGSGEIKVEPLVTQPDPSNATFEFEDGPVTLKDGKASVPVAPGSAMEAETILTETVAYGDVNEDENNDAVVILIQDSGGSGLFVYIAAYVSGNVGYRGSNAIFIGDRISPQSLTINKTGVISLDYLDRKETDPMAADPTIPITKNFRYSSNTLEEI